MKKPNESNKTNKSNLPSGKDGLKRIQSIVPPVAKRFRKPSLQQQTEEALSAVPRITNETIAEHREEVLKGARRFKYPLEHSKHKIVIVSSLILGLSLVAFLTATILSLYRFQTTSAFAYRITQFLPLPVAKVGDDFVAYENYLFEVRRFKHYYETQQQVDFTNKASVSQLDNYKPQAMQKVVNQVYIKELADKHNVTVSDAEVQDALDMLQSQNRLSGTRELESVIRRYYNWSLGDLRRVLKEEILAQKVAAELDDKKHNTAADVLLQLREGGDFAALAKQYSDDAATKDNAGQYANTALAVGDQTVAPKVIRELSRLKPGEVSGIITTPTSFEIVKLIEKDATGKYKAAHIEFRFAPVGTYTKKLAESTKVKYYINLPKQSVTMPKSGNSQ